MRKGAGLRDHAGRRIDFGRAAEDYERHRPGFPDSFFERLLDNGWMAEGRRALALGTGTGSLALGLSARGLEVTGLDLAPRLLEVARRAAEHRGLSAQFIEGRAEATGQPEAGFDLVSAGQCWWWFEARRPALRIRARPATEAHDPVMGAGGGNGPAGPRDPPGRGGGGA